jgi:hypothetical protein
MIWSETGINIIKGFDMDTVCSSMKDKYNKAIDKHGFLGSTYYGSFDELHSLDKEAFYQNFDYLDLKHDDSQLLS